MKNQVEKRFIKSITKHAKKFIKDLRHKSKFKKVAYKHLRRELYRYLHKKQQNKINNGLQKLKLAKLANNNTSESDLVNIRQLNALPIKNLRQMLRNIRTNLSKSDIIYALIRSEPIINEQKYIFDSNNEIHSKINDVRIHLLMYLPILTKRNKIILEKDYMRSKI